jgi:hypothetical protein
MLKRYKGTVGAQKALGILSLVAGVTAIASAFHVFFMVDTTHDAALVAQERWVRTVAAAGSLAFALISGFGIIVLEWTKTTRDLRQSPGNPGIGFFQWLSYDKRKCAQCQGPKKYGRVEYLHWEDGDQPTSIYLGYRCPHCDVPDERFRLEEWNEEMIRRDEFERNVIFVERP